MKFTYQWLKEYLATEASVTEIADTLTAIGLEVEEVQDIAKDLKDFIVVEIRNTEPHPNAEKLQICTVYDGMQEHRIVCGAPNARSGIKAIFAPLGTVIPSNNMVIKAVHIRGVPSAGMLCSAQELGLDTEEEAGIVELPKDAPIGKGIISILGRDDPVFDIAITPNRGDCLGVYGIARDLAAAGIGRLKPIPLPTVVTSGESSIGVTIAEEALTDCPLFVGRMIRNVKNTESPDWLKKRLRAIGVNSISALVDITNYISFNFGRPLHVYDAQRLSGSLHIKHLEKSTSFTALNGMSYELQKGSLVVADDKQVQALAGIIGGQALGCDEHTTQVFLEVALFSPDSVAKQGRIYDIVTDARYRFERQVDPAFLFSAADLATKMILELCGGEASSLVVAGEEPQWQRDIIFPKDELNRLSGVNVGEMEVETILRNLGFKIKEQNTTWKVEVPSWRSDVQLKADLVEEVLRVYGYDKIQSVPLPYITPRSLSLRQKCLHNTRRILATRGIAEVVSWSFMDSKKAALCASGCLSLANPISAELNVMRPSIIPNLVDIQVKNAHRSYENNAFFEIGPVYDVTNTFPGNPHVVAVIRAGQARAKTPLEENREVDVFDIKADLLSVLHIIGAPDSIQFKQERDLLPPYYHPGRAAVLQLGKHLLGYMGELHPYFLKAFDCEQKVVGFELFLSSVPLKKNDKASRPGLLLSDYPSVRRDFAFIVEETVTAEMLTRTLYAVDKTLITEVIIFDVYRGKGIPEGKKSVALSVTLQAANRTLKEAEIEAVATHIITHIHKQHGGVLR